MLYRVIDADKLSSLVRGFMNDYEVIAPVKRDQGYVFAVIHDPDEVEFDYTTTITSPKKFFLPSEEVLMRFDAEENEVTDFAIDLKPRVLFGVHPCDINALNRLDLVYKDCAYPDPYYTKRRENTLIVGLAACQGLRASATCAAPMKRAWVPICSCRRSAISTLSRLRALRQRACSKHRAILSMQPTKTVVSSVA